LQPKIFWQSQYSHLSLSLIKHKGGEKMVKEKTTKTTLKKRALDEIAARNDVKGLVLHNIEEDDALSINKKVYRYTAAKKTEPNGPQYTVILDQDGEILDPKSLNAKEGRKVFAANIASVSTLVTTVEALKPAGSITIEPQINDLVLNKGDSHNEVITVNVPGSAGVNKVDVYFLADTTASMTGVINQVCTGASSILNALSAPGLDMAFGVGNYRDFPHDTYAFKHQLNPTTVKADAQSAINSWTTSGGWDSPEAQLFALDQLAESPGGSIGWRNMSKRIIVWFGDYPGHDPICQKISGLSYDITEDSVKKKLINEGIIVLAISTTTGSSLDGDPTSGSADYTGICSINGNPNQATNIAKATGGTHVTGIDASTIVNTIIELITTTVTQITKLNLVPTGDSARFIASISPASGYGPLYSDNNYTLNFDVRFVGVENCGEDPQIFTGTIDVVADGVVVARKRVRITVPACKEQLLHSYSVKFVCGIQKDRDRDCTPVRPGIYATEINIHNFSSTEAKIHKLLLPTVFAGAPAGREPRIVEPKIVDTIVLPPNTATMDDCYRIAELLFGARPPMPMPLTIGFIEIISPVELAVTAVYTVTDLKSTSISIDVEQINGHPKPLPEMPAIAVKPHELL
jgi:hypothetical protein